MITHDINTDKSKKVTISAISLSVILLFITALSIITILHKKQIEGSQYASIYQEGKLIKIIDLSSVTDSYFFTLTLDNGSYNTITVKSGSIAITDANCPDRLCVTLGFQDKSLLPIVCLPHKLVILLHENTSDEPDIITY